jgi:hypothetical protein
MTESSDGLREKLDARSRQYADELARSEIELIDLAKTALAQWRAWWRDPPSMSELSIDARLHDKFMMCFPLAAHAMNHVEAALEARQRFPWVTKTSARIAFEHALTAQWILLTSDGERKWKANFDNNDHTRTERLIRGVQRLGHDDEEFALAAHGLSDEELLGLVQAKAQGPGADNVEGMCRRFACGGADDLLYHIYRDLSGAVHPSLSLLCAHWRFDAKAKPLGVNPFGDAGEESLLGRELALSAMWALYSVEVCRFEQPRMALVASMGATAGLPVDLRSSDQRPDKQPNDHTAYWLAPAGGDAPDRVQTA